MRLSLLLKRADIALQVLSLVVTYAAVVLSGALASAFWIYVCVGAVQVSSFLLHLLFQGSRWIHAARRAYGTALGWTLMLCTAVGVCCWIAPPLFWLLTYVVLWALLLGTPALAAWYFAISLREERAIRQLIQREALLVRSV